MKKILVTGFQPFDNDLLNPSEMLVNFLENNKNLLYQSDYISTAILPVSFNSSFSKLNDLCNEINPDLIIATGFAKERSKINLEKVAINWIDARIPDNDGVKPEFKRVDEFEKDALFSKIPIEKLLSKLNSNAFDISYSAGAFVCNYLYFKSLTVLKCPVIFLHIPGRSDLVYNHQFELIIQLINILQKEDL